MQDHIATQFDANYKYKQAFPLLNGVDHAVPYAISAFALRSITEVFPGGTFTDDCQPINNATLASFAIFYPLVKTIAYTNSTVLLAPGMQLPFSAATDYSVEGHPLLPSRINYQVTKLNHIYSVYITYRH